MHKVFISIAFMSLLLGGCRPYCRLPLQRSHDILVDGRNVTFRAPGSITISSPVGRVTITSKTIGMQCTHVSVSINGGFPTEQQVCPIKDGPDMVIESK